MAEPFKEFDCEAPWPRIFQLQKINTTLT